MSKPPSYPEEAPVGDPVGKSDPIPLEPKAKPTPEGTRTRNIVTGAAIGIGSAALVAALLYANRSRKGSNKAVSMPEKTRDPSSAES